MINLIWVKGVFKIHAQVQFQGIFGALLRAIRAGFT